MSWRALALLLVVAPAAHAGELDAQAGLDFFRADSVSGATGAGAPVRIGAQELGITARLRLKEFDDRLKLRVDYRGREPIEGQIRNRDLRLLWEAQASFDIIEDWWTVGVGRFVAPTTVFLPMDGMWTEVRFPFQLRVRAFAGRRAITTSRRNLGFDKFLPALGGMLSYDAGRYLRAEAVVGYAEDSGLFAVQGGQDIRRKWGSLNARVVLTSNPIDDLYLGLTGTFAEQAQFLLGPTWAAGDIEVRATELMTGYFYGEYRPWEWLRAGYDVHFQQAAALVAGTVNGVDPNLIRPEFIDNRVRLAVAPFDLGWIRAQFRHRLRPKRQEFRYLLTIEANELYLPGLYFRGRIAYEDLIHDADVVDPDQLNRLLWSAALGYDGFGFDVSVGVSYMDRAASVVSGRQSGPGAPSSPVDLAPFVLSAQRIFFVRAFYDNEYFFAGLDFERNLEDDEYRFVLQGGAYWELLW